MSKLVSSLFSGNAGDVGTESTVNVVIVKRISRELADDTVKSFTRTSPLVAPNEHAKTLRRTVEEISCRHEIVFSSMVRRLTESVTCEDGATLGTSFQRIADELFRDGHINWGRIVTVYAFAGWLARHTMKNVAKNLSVDSVDGMSCSSDEISRLCGDYVAENLSDWILKQGGWDTFDKFFFKHETADNVIWQGLLYTFAGLAALATLTTALKK